MSVFASPALAQGYAHARPPVHPLVLEQALDAPVHRALDLGSGAGISTRALSRHAQHRVGIEPVHAMSALAPSVAPGAEFCTAVVEGLPFGDHTFPLATAAGSLNYTTDLGQAFREIHRVVAPGGALLVYDFTPGTVGTWFDSFSQRYPVPPSSARLLDPMVLKEHANGFVLARAKEYTVEIPMDATGYEKYMMTETNVGHAMENGTPEADVRQWIRQTLAPIFADGQRDVVIRGYWALFTAL